VRKQKKNREGEKRKETFLFEGKREAGEKRPSGQKEGANSRTKKKGGGFRGGGRGAGGTAAGSAEKKKQPTIEKGGTALGQKSYAARGGGGWGESGPHERVEVVGGKGEDGKHPFPAERYTG